MNINITGFIYHKAAEDFSDCFDRYAINQEKNKFSISDGVSKSFFPGIWAELLVNTYVNTSESINFDSPELLLKLQKEWLEKVTKIVNKPDQKYFVRNRFNQGGAAAATFVGLSFNADENGIYKWESYALGDSFLFFVPDLAENLDDNFEGKIDYLSSKKTFEFDNYPDFFESRNQNHKGKSQRKEGQLQSGIFYLMTDALAEWFIKEKENARQEINNWKNQDDFERRIEELRKSNLLNNDDSAILIIRIEDDKKEKITYDLSNSISKIDKLIIEENLKQEQSKNITPEANENIVNENIVRTENQEPVNETDGLIQKSITTLTSKF